MAACPPRPDFRAPAFAAVLRTLAAAVLAAGLISACGPRLQPSGPAEQAPRLEEGHLVTSDGIRLGLSHWESVDRTPRTVLIGLHGYNDYSNAFAKPARFLADHGVATYAFDQRGFGRSPHRGVWAGTDVMVRDVGDAVRAVRDRHPEADLFLLGESMGGAAAMVAMAADPDLPVTGAVLVAPAVWGSRYIGVVGTELLRLVAHLFPAMVMRVETNIRPSDNRAMLSALGRDGLVIRKPRAGTLWGLVRLMDEALASAGGLRRPTLFLYGLKDDLVPIAPTLEALAAMDASHRRLAVYEDGYHMLLRDLKAKRVWTDILAWLERRDEPLPSGAGRAAMTRLERRR